VTAVFSRIRLTILLIAALAFALSVNVHADDEVGATTYVELLPSFVINYGGKGKLRYVRTQITLRVRVGSYEQDVRRHVYGIRHAIVMGLSAADADDIETNEGQDKVRKQLLEEVQAFLQKEVGEQGVTDLLFQSFVIQR